MKNWIIYCLVALGGYAIYSHWFASAAAPEEPANAHKLVLDPAPALESDTNSRPDSARPLRLNLDEDSRATAAPQADPTDRSGQPERIDESWRLYLARRKAIDDALGATVTKLTVRILGEFPDSDAARWIHFERGREALQQYRKLRWKKEGLRRAQEARRELTPALFLSRAEPADREQLRATLAELADAVFFSPRHVEGVDRIYTPQRGATLAVLCRRVFPKWGAHLSPGLVVEVNRLKSPEALRAREPIKVPLGKPRIVVVKSEYRLYFLMDGAYVRDFPIGLGREDSTPEATFSIQLKQKNPDWYPRVGVRIKYGDPRNVLGTRWLGFGSDADYRGFGIHGTSDPASIGKQASSGCVRMLRVDVETLFGWTPQGTRVDILP